MNAEWQQALEPLSEESLHSLVRREELGELNFSEAVAKLAIVRRIAEALTQEDQAELPSTVQTTALNHLTQAAGLVDRMREFTLAQDQSSTLHTNIVAEAENLREAMSQNVRPHIKGEVLEMGERNAELLAAMARTREAASEAEEILVRLRKAAGETGAGNLAAYYGKQADTHKDEAKDNLRNVGIATALAIMLGLWLFVLDPPSAGNDVSVGILVRESVGRLFFLGLSLSTVAFFLRNYRAHKHLQVLNEGKCNALDTYPLFQEAGRSEAVVDIITSQLATAVFASDETGFLSRASEQRIVASTPGLLGSVTQSRS